MVNVEILLALFGIFAWFMLHSVEFLGALKKPQIRKMHGMVYVFFAAIFAVLTFLMI